MPRCFPGSQSQAVMKEKESVARYLTAQGLNNTQISVQLRCSAQFVRDVRAKLEREGGSSAVAS
jgi:transposase